uniref:Ribosomal protein S4 n=1 Tax=Paraprenanthes diversifolia TaxID=1400673 RepID=A0A6B9SB21_9ASTR|nr:ribosomal protein S4 [Paraprenanthes diversifolia]
MKKKKREENSQLYMLEFAPIFISFVSSLLVSLIILGILILNSDQTTRKLPADLIFVVTTLCFLMSFGIPVAFSAGESLSAVPSHSDWFTYTDDMLEDSASSGRSSSTSAVNQPLPGEQATPPALPVMQGARTLPYVPYPYDPEEVIGGDSVRSIEGRLLSGKTAPSPLDIYLARINAEDLFEVKVDIIREMAGLHPSGDWLGRGARALDNPRGEESLGKLLQMLADLRTRNFQSETFGLLKGKVFLRDTPPSEGSSA